MSNKVTLTGHFTLLDGTPAEGIALIRPSRSPILDLAGKQVIAGPQRFTLDAGGRFSVGLPPTDDPALGEPFTYDVMVTMDHTNWQVTGLTLPADMISVDVLDPPAGVVKEYPTRAEWDALTSAAVAEMETALDGAESARDTAVSARDNAVVARDETLTARDVTFTARDTAVDAAAETVTARTETLPARDEALAARDVTVEARGETLTARDEALTARSETITALAGKVTGTGMTLRHDTTVGTRVFLDHPGGSTMLYGDTGWRDVSSLLINGWGGALYYRRVKDNHILHAFGLDPTNATNARFLSNIPIWQAQFYWRGATFTGGMSWTRLVAPGAYAWIPKEPQHGEIRWSKTNAWPSTLPGTPA